MEPNELDFDTEAARSALEQDFEALRRHDLAPVVSSERLSGHPMAGGRDSATLAHRIVETLPGALVLIVVREQRSILLSVHRQYVRAGGALPVAELLEPRVRTRTRVPQFDWRHFEYDRLIATYRELFGPERVLVLAYEQLVAEPAAFVNQVAAFADLPLPEGFLERLPWDARPNRSTPPVLTSLQRHANRLLVRSDLNPSPLLRSEWVARAVKAPLVALDRHASRRLQARLQQREGAAVAAFAEGRYEESNGRTAALTGLELESLGWAV